MEGLDIAMQDAIGGGFFNGLKLKDSELQISHLIYADDVVFLGEWSRANIENLVVILHFFYKASGLKLNLAKSDLYGVGVDQDEVSTLATVVGCKPDRLPFSYLGVSVGDNMARVRSWDKLEKKFQSKLSNWKVKAMSIGGRSILAKHVLGSMGIYWMSLFVMPVAVARKLEKMRALFFWGGKDDEKKLHWIKWEGVLASLDHGGLNIGSLMGFNFGLILKWRWRFLTSGDSLWVKVIKNLHGEDGGFDAGSSRMSGTSPWSRIRAACVKLDAKGVVPLSVLHKVVGSGTDTRFWRDTWVGDRSLSLLFPRLFALEVDPNCLVSDRRVEGVWVWNWRRQLRGGAESVQFSGLLNKLVGWESTTGRDKWSCSLSPNGEFSVALARKMVDDSELPNSLKPTRWCSEAPRKVNIHVWRVLNDRLPTRVALEHRGIDIPDLLCPLCGVEVENLEHTFVRCEVAARTWDAIFRWLDIESPGSLSCTGWFDWIDGLRLGTNQKKNIQIVVMAGIWLLWKFRNDHVFGKNKMRRSEMVDGIKDVAFFWICNHRKSFSSKWVSWLTNPLTLV